MLNTFFVFLFIFQLFVIYLFVMASKCARTSLLPWVFLRRTLFQRRLHISLNFNAWLGRRWKNWAFKPFLWEFLHSSPQVKRVLRSHSIKGNGKTTTYMITELTTLTIKLWLATKSYKTDHNYFIWVRRQNQQLLENSWAKTPTS